MITGELLWIVMSYIVGSIPFGVVIGKTFCGIDPRTSGSMSSGATNVSRLCGLPYGVLTLACDVAKGALPVGIGMLLDTSPFFLSMTGAACITGHVYSCFMRFRGGKAIATTIGVFIPLAFWPLLGSCALCMLVIWRSGFVSLGSLTLLASLPFFLYIADLAQWLPLSLFAVLIGFYRHKDNIKRLMKGEEKPWLKKADRS